MRARARSGRGGVAARAARRAALAVHSRPHALLAQEASGLVWGSDSARHLTSVLLEDDKPSDNVLLVGRYPLDPALLLVNWLREIDSVERKDL